MYNAISVNAIDTNMSMRPEKNKVLLSHPSRQRNRPIMLPRMLASLVYLTPAHQSFRTFAVSSRILSISPPITPQSQRGLIAHEKNIIQNRTQEGINGKDRYCTSKSIITRTVRETIGKDGRSGILRAPWNGKRGPIRRNKGEEVKQKKIWYTVS